MPTDTGESPLAAMTELGKYHLSLLRRSGKERNRYHASVGRFFLVLTCVIPILTMTEALASPEASEVLAAG